MKDNKNKVKKKALSTAELTKNHEQFMKGKEVNPNNAALFEKALKKATKPKPRGSK